MILDDIDIALVNARCAIEGKVALLKMKLELEKMKMDMRIVYFVCWLRLKLGIWI